MSVKRFSTGQQFQWNGSVFEVKRLLPEAKINVEDIFTGAVQVVAMRELIVALFDGDLRFVVENRTGRASKCGGPLPEEKRIDLADYPEHLVEIARFRLGVIEPLLDLAPSKRSRKVLECRAQEVKDSLQGTADEDKFLRGLSRRSVYRWLGNYEDAGRDLRALIPNTGRCGGPGKSRLPAEVRNLMDAVIGDHYYSREKVTLFDLRCFLATRIEEENRLRPASEQLALPSRGAIARRINTLDMQRRYTAKHGSRAAKRKFTQVGQMTYPALPGERVEIDHTKIDLIVVDENDNLPLGRPTLTYCLDTPTRYPLGYYLGFEPPSYYTVMECLYHAIRPKENLRERYDMEHDWLAYGIPSMLVVDNGKEFIGRDLSDACELLGIILAYTPVKTPEFKAAVERMFGTLNSGLFHALPGTTFSNIFERGDYDSAKLACVSLEEIEQALNIFTVDIYAERFHKGLDGVPARRWERAVEAGFSPRLPPDSEELLILLGRVDHRVIQSTGISFHRLRYNCPELSPIRARLKGERAKIKYHPADLSRLYVFDPLEKRYVEVPSLDPEYTQGLSLWKHEVILNFLHSQDEEVDLAALGRAKRRIQEIVEAARTRKRVSSRARIARWDLGGQPPSLVEKGQGPPSTGNTPQVEGAQAPAALPLPDDDDAILGLEPFEEDDDADGWSLTYADDTPVDREPVAVQEVIADD